MENNEFIKTLTNIRSLRAMTREVSFSALEDMLTKLSSLVEERRAAAEIEKKSNSERLAKLEAYKKMLAEDGISLSDLVSAHTTQSSDKKTRKPKPPKYEYHDDNGDVQTWTGQGRMPKAIATAIEAGSSLECFLVKPLT